MIEKQTVVESITIDSQINVRLKKQLVENGEVLGHTWHRFGINQATNIDALVIAVNTDLDAQGFPPVSTEDVDKIKAYAAVAWAD